MDPPEYGTVTISIKPKNGTYVSTFNKEQIKNKLKQYSISGINQKLSISKYSMLRSIVMPIIIQIK